MTLEQQDYLAPPKEDDTRAYVARLEDALLVANEAMDAAGTAYVELRERFDSVCTGVQLAATQDDVTRQALREQLRASEAENAELRERLATLGAA